MDFRLKHFLKKNKIITKTTYLLRERRTVRRISSYQALAVDKNKILFASGRYGDSLCALSETLHTMNPELKMVWAYRSGDEKYIREYPDYVKPILFESSEYYKQLSTSAVWVFNVLVPQGTSKRKEQLYIQVWHGDKPFKKIGNEAAKDKKSYQKQSKGRRFQEDELCDYFVTGSLLFIDIWEKSMGYHGKILSTGLPRNDVLLTGDDGKSQFIRNELGIPSDVCVMLYAPTFRDHIVDNANIGTDINLSEVLNALEMKSNKKWICIKRSHGGYQLVLKSTGADTRILDVSQYRDMTNLMLISDLLLTDYSSCAGDFAYTGKPVLLYQDDYETYTSKDRSLIFDMKKTPFLVAHNMEELIDLIRSLDSEKAKKNDAEILALYSSSQTDHSSRDVANIILNHIKKIHGTKSE